MLNINRGTPQNAQMIAEFISRVTHKLVNRIDVMMSYGNTSYFIAIFDGEILGLVKWRAENLVGFTDEFLFDGNQLAASGVRHIGKLLVEHVESACKQLVSSSLIVIIDAGTTIEIFQLLQELDFILLSSSHLDSELKTTIVQHGKKDINPDTLIAIKSPQLSRPLLHIETSKQISTEQIQSISQSSVKKNNDQDISSKTTVFTNSKSIINVIGLTASGKTTVLRMLQHMGAYTIDIEQLRLQSVRQGGPNHKSVVERYPIILDELSKNLTTLQLIDFMLKNSIPIKDYYELTDVALFSTLNTLINRSKQRVVAVESSFVIAGIKPSYIWFVNAPKQIRRARLLKQFANNNEMVTRLMEVDTESTNVQLSATIDNDQIVENTWEQVQLVWSEIKQPFPVASLPAAQSSISAPSAEIESGISLDDTNFKKPPVHFSAFYPRDANPVQSYNLLVYAHNQNAKEIVFNDVKKFSDELGGNIVNPRTSKHSTQIKPDTPITIVPECDEIEFEPPILTKKWRENWIRFGFDYVIPQDYIDETLLVRVSIQVENIEIAHIKLAIDVTSENEDTNEQTIHENPLAQAKYANETTVPYQRIFISYSRKDSEIARNYKLAQTALGNDAFLDIDNLRTGENWQAALARAIDSSDIFQLFWSDYSANSEYCRYEWEYTLKYRCSDNKCSDFIRPVYWSKPMPTPPKDLNHLNFRFVPLTEESRGD